MRRVLLTGTAVLGVLVAAGGTWAALHPLVRPQDYGWTAYAPLSAKQYLPVVEPPWWSLALVAVGAFALGVAVALLLTGRSRTRA